MSARVRPPGANRRESGPIPRTVEIGRENGLERAAEIARERLASVTETRARLIVHLHGRAGDARDELDSETRAAKREHEQHEREAAYERHLQRKYGRGGSDNGPRRQCAGCKKFLGLGEFQCESCGFLEGAGYSGDGRWR